MKKTLAVILAVIMVVGLPITALARWSTIKTASLSVGASSATAGMTSLTADLEVFIEIYEDGRLVKTASNSKSSSNSIGVTASYTWKSGKSYEIIAYFDADGETHEITKYK